MYFKILHLCNIFSNDSELNRLILSNTVRMMFFFVLHLCEHMYFLLNLLNIIYETLSGTDEFQHELSHDFLHRGCQSHLVS